MKKLSELSKTELLHLILNRLEIGIDESCIECAGCGITAKAKLYYVCDVCQESLEKDKL